MRHMSGQAPAQSDRWSKTAAKKSKCQVGRGSGAWFHRETTPGRRHGWAKSKWSGNNLWSWRANGIATAICDDYDFLACSWIHTVLLGALKCFVLFFQIDQIIIFPSIRLVRYKPTLDPPDDGKAATTINRIHHWLPLMYKSSVEDHVSEHEHWWL